MFEKSIPYTGKVETTLIVTVDIVDPKGKYICSGSGCSYDMQLDSNVVDALGESFHE